MDLATVLANVNARVYATPQQYLADIGRIVQVGGWAGRGHGSCSSAGGRLHASAQQDLRNNPPC